MALPNTIIVTGFAGRRHEEICGTASTLPGMFVRPNGTAIDNGCRATVVQMDTAGADYETRIVIEDMLVGGTVDTVFGVGDTIQTYTPNPGEIGLARLTYGVSYDEGDRLIFSNDGTLKKFTGTPYKVVATIREAIDLTAEVATKLGKVTFA